MRADPFDVILAHLIHVVRDVALLPFDPEFQADAAFFGVLDRVGPDRFRDGDKKLIRHLTQAADDFEGFARALVKIAQVSGPASGIEFGYLGARPRDPAPAHPVAPWS